MKRLLPLGVLLLTAGAHAGVIVPIMDGGGGGGSAPKGRCSGIAELEKQLAAESLVLPANAGDEKTKFKGKEHCSHEIWNYLQNKAKERTGFNTLDGKMQLELIKKYAGQFDEVDALAAKIAPLVESYRAEVLLFRAADTKPLKRIELLPRLISKEGDDRHLGIKEAAKPVEGGHSYAGVMAAFRAVAAHPLAAAHGAKASDPFNTAAMRNLYTPQTHTASKAREGAFSAIAWGQGDHLWAQYKATLDILNGINKEVKQNGGTVAGLLKDLKVEVLFQAEKDKQNGGATGDVKPNVTDQGTQVSGDLASFTKAFETKASAEIFDGMRNQITARTKLDASDPNHLTDSQALKAYENLSADFKSAKAEVNGDKIAMVITQDGKKVTLKEVAMPKELTVKAGEDLGAQVGKDILNGDIAKGKFTAVIAAITGNEVPKDHVQHTEKPNLTGPQGGGDAGGPTGFAKNVKDADCGGVSDIGKNDQTLALKARNKEIAKLSADYSAARAKVTEEHDKAIIKAKEKYDAKVASIDAQAARERENPFFSDFEGQAARVKASKTDAKKEYDDEIARLNAEQKAAFEKGGKVGTKEDVDAQAKALEKVKNEEVRAYYKTEVTARVDTLWGLYKKKDARKVLALAQRLGSVERPLDMSYLTSDLFDSFFKERYSGDVREKNIDQVVVKIGVPKEGNLKGSVPEIGKTDEIIEGELHGWFKAKMATKEKNRKAYEESQKGKK